MTHITLRLEMSPKDIGGFVEWAGKEETVGGKKKTDYIKKRKLRVGKEENI